MQEDFLQGLEQFKSQVDAVLKKKSSYLRPKRAHIWYDFLCYETPVGKPLVHFYNTVPYEKTNGWSAFIIHGHDDTDLCFTSYFCHEMNWLPDPNVHNPSFVAMFRRKWNPIYEGREQDQGLEKHGKEKGKEDFVLIL